MRDEFSTLDIVKKLPIPRERLREWMVRGFVKPSYPSVKQGSRATFTRSDVYGVALFKYLIERGYRRKYASSFVSEFVELGGFEKIEHILFRRSRKGEIRAIKILAGTKWLIDPKTGYPGLYRPGDPFAPIAPGSPEDEEYEDFLVVPFERLRKQVDDALASL